MDTHASIAPGRRSLSAWLRARAGALRWLAGVAFLALLLRDPAGALEASREALRTWANSVAPSLFPFMAVLPLLTSLEARALYERLLARPMRRLFHLPGSAASAVSVGLLAGSPAGALACARVAEGMRRGDFKRMALISCGASPVYLISGIGVSLLDSREAGTLLAGAQLVSQLIGGFALRWAFRGEDAILSAPPMQAAERPVRAAVLGVLQIAGYMALFAVLARFAAGLLGERAGAACRMLLDLPGGASVAANLPAGAKLYGVPLRLPLLAAMSGFAGVCIGAQNLSVLGPLGLRWREYIGFKAAQGVLCALFCAAGQGLLPPAAMPAFARLAAAPVRLSSLGMLCALVPGLIAFALPEDGD